MRLHLGYILIFWAFVASSQASISKKEAIEKIQSLQVESHDFYDAGLFPSTRYWFSLSSGVDDNSVFPTASIIYILRSLNDNNQLDDIVKKAIPVFESYRSRRGEAAYNNWQTISPDLPFPNSTFLNRECYRLPDDYDDTAIVQLAKGANKLDASVRKKMIDYANRSSRKEVPGFLKKYKKHKAFEVWYTDKMTQEYDLAVMCNVLLFTFEKGFELKPTDLETINLIKEVLVDKAHIQQPEAVSPYYGNPAILLYHLSRMIESDQEGHFESLKKGLVMDCNAALERTENSMKRSLIYTSLHKLGVKVNATANESELRSAIKSFKFYEYQPQSSLMSMLPKMRWKSEAVNWAFVLEFLTYYEGRINWSDAK